MKLSSISLIVAALAAIAGSVTAAPAPRPLEHGVDIYSHTTVKELHTEAEKHHASRASYLWKASVDADNSGKGNIALSYAEAASYHHRNREEHRSAGRHQISIDKSTAAAKLTGAAKQYRDSAYHHLAIETHTECRDGHEGALKGGNKFPLSSTYLCDSTDARAEEDIKRAKEILRIKHSTGKK